MLLQLLIKAENGEESSEITYEDIERVNSALKTTDIKGKDYAEVPQRIKAFRMLFPLGKIVTNMISNSTGVCVFRAEIYADENTLLGTGTAYEKENSTFINKTSYIENCETSAVGRALGMCGFGIDTSVASAEEVGNAIEQQKQLEQKNKPSPRQKLIYCLNQRGIDVTSYSKEKGLTKDTPPERFIELLNELAQEG